MLFWLTIIITAGLFIASGITSKKIRSCSDDVSVGLFACGVFMAIALGIMSIFLCMAHIQKTGNIAEMQETYKSLIYKAETESIRDEFGIVNKEYVDEVQEWNEKLAWRQAMQDNFWVGVFYPDIYDAFEYIDLNSIAIRE